MRNLIAVCLTLITVATVYGSQPGLEAIGPFMGRGPLGMNFTLRLTG